MFTQFYTRTEDQTDEHVIAEVKKLTKLLGGKIDDNRWHTFDKFTYFQHFTLEQIKLGIYSHLAGMQGNDRTFYVGGATDFEFVEPSSCIRSTSSRSTSPAYGADASAPGEGRIGQRIGSSLAFCHTLPGADYPAHS